MVKCRGSSDLMKRLALVYCIASLYRVHGRKYNVFLFNSLVQLISGIPDKDVDALLDEMVSGKLNPAYFDSYEL